jgi:hypothetical protein
LSYRGCTFSKDPSQIAEYNTLLIMKYINMLDIIT